MAAGIDLSELSDVPRAFPSASHTHSRVCNRSLGPFELYGAANDSGAVIDFDMKTRTRFLHFKVLVDGRSARCQAIEGGADSRGTLGGYPHADRAGPQAADRKGAIGRHRRPPASGNLSFSRGDTVREYCKIRKQTHQLLRRQASRRNVT